MILEPQNWYQNFEYQMTHHYMISLLWVTTKEPLFINLDYMLFINHVMPHYLVPSLVAVVALIYNFVQKRFDLDNKFSL